MRDSLDLIRIVRPEAGTAALDHEINAERANSVNAAEARVKKAIAALNAAAEREPYLSEARDAVWSYFVQREIIGFRRHQDVILDLAIPQDVLNGLGAMGAKSK
ncbi:hypothetical protein VE26_08455 [Devosia chinhatensis]|uniref:Uncharacterized protein n=1 Tax=Devosia chinhatensis TaxID=429727 RepID=A0A0F5FNE7_9HYPH|nr:hypothetical protein VE26_08455 [Devosia chinhatensis]